MKKTILVTGASSGIGKATAKLFHQNGWNVIATMRQPEKEEELVSLEDVLVAKLDVLDAGSIAAAIESGIKRFGRIDVLLNNAGFGAYGPLEATSIETIERQFDTMDANVRIASVFNELLERQFPVESVQQRFALRSANDFAERMSIHVNHLNRAMKHATGKTTTALISERLVAEATALLKHTAWNISEISYTLGFEDPAHFNHFFKKHTRSTPSSFRS
ncbi:MAG TPA: SDR family NAD(P)-dependent oxidoreductase [Chitinophaga sp.]|uniref:SDR family NAD(P)-dependent oxidoreductase n=1 Tax=Chitinophaga sp. TaxID=1869181 RepID=UPI002F91F670